MNIAYGGTAPHTYRAILQILLYFMEKLPKRNTKEVTTITAAKHYAPFSADTDFSGP